MARSDLVRRLLASWASRDDSAFLAAAHEVVEDERKKGHRLLAAQLEDVLSDPRRPGAREALALHPVPKGRDERPLLALSKPNWELADLVLPEAVAQCLLELVDEHQRRSLLRTHSLRPRQRVLLVGPSGSGKSATAHALASALSLPVAAANLAGLVSSFLGETSRNVEAVVRFAERTPCVLLFDEFDAVSGDRSANGDHGEIRRVVATVLQALERPVGESLIVATSNHPALLDDAVWRRFDEVVAYDRPDQRLVALLLDLRIGALRGSVEVDRWADRLSGSSAADVEAIALDAMRLCLLDGTGLVHDRHIAWAVHRLERRAAAVRGATKP